MNDNELLLAMCTNTQELKQKVTGIETKIDNIEVRLDNLEVRFNNLETKVDNIEVRFDKLESSFDNLETRFDALEKKVDSLDMKSDSQEARIANIELALENETNHNIRLLAENHGNLIDKPNQAIPIADKNLVCEVRVNYLLTEVDSLKKEIAEIKTRIA